MRRRALSVRTRVSIRACTRPTELIKSDGHRLYRERRQRDMSAVQYREEEEVGVCVWVRSAVVPRAPLWEVNFNRGSSRA